MTEIGQHTKEPWTDWGLGLRKAGWTTGPEAATCYGMESAAHGRCTQRVTQQADVDDGGRSVAVVVGKDKATTDANARRIVACVNALEGFSTDALGAGVVKELLEACDHAMRELGDSLHVLPPVQDDEEISEVRTLRCHINMTLTELREAYRKMEGLQP